MGPRATCLQTVFAQRACTRTHDQSIARWTSDEYARILRTLSLVLWGQAVRNVPSQPTTHIPSPSQHYRIASPTLKSDITTPVSRSPSPLRARRGRVPARSLFRIQHDFKRGARGPARCQDPPRPGIAPHWNWESEGAEVPLLCRPACQARSAIGVQFPAAADAGFCREPNAQKVGNGRGVDFGRFRPQESRCRGVRNVRPAAQPVRRDMGTGEAEASARRTCAPVQSAVVRLSEPLRMQPLLDAAHATRQTRHTTGAG